MVDENQVAVPQRSGRERPDPLRGETLRFLAKNIPGDADFPQALLDEERMIGHRIGGRCGIIELVDLHPGIHSERILRSCRTRKRAARTIVAKPGSPRPSNCRRSSQNLKKSATAMVCGRWCTFFSHSFW